MTAPAAVASALPERRRVTVFAALLLALLAPLSFGVSATGAVGAAFLATLAVVTIKDLEERRIPNVVVLPATALVLLAVAVLRPDHAVEAVVASLGAGAFFLVPGLIARGAVGMGDVKLALLLGAALGRGVVVALLLGCATASIAGLVLLVRHGRAARKASLPFAPFLTLGALAALALGVPHAL